MSKFLVIGEYCVDRYIKGECSRISQEAPVPVIKVEEEEVRLGMAANVVMNLKALGEEVMFLTLNGTAKVGYDILKLFVDRELYQFHAFNDSTRQQIIKTRIVPRDHQLVRLDEEHTHPISFELEQKIEQAVAKYLPEYDALILQDYGKGLFTRGLTNSLLRLAKKLDKPTFVDPNKGSDLSYYEHATLIKPNMEEGKVLTGESSPDHILATIQKATHCKYIVLTNGKHGMIGAEGDTTVELPAAAKTALDVTGAGDTVLAALASSLVSGKGLKEAMEYANMAGGIVVNKHGTAIVTKEEIDASSSNK